MISYLVNYFNTDGLKRENNIKPIIDALKKSTNKDIEIFWNIDSKKEFLNMENDISILKKNLLGIKHEILLSNNNGELVGYNNMIKKTSGKYIVFLQDDDIPPNYNWMDECIDIFEKYEKVGLIGLQDGGPGIYITPPWKHCNRHVKLHYAGNVNIGPLIIKRDVFDIIGLLNEDYVLNNNPFSGCGVDMDIVAKCWINDIHVLKYKLNTDFNRFVGGRGSKRNDKVSKIRTEGVLNSDKIFYKLYKSLEKNINNKIYELNKKDFPESVSKLILNK
tara:strand:+ start:308 stop:1135 length:828 start_codon:yes stop_codon:yes gene_type:complete